MAIERIVVVTKATALEGLIGRYNTREQARFYVEHMGASFGEYEAAHAQYHQSLALLLDQIPAGVRLHVIDRSFVPTYTFGSGDLIVTLGPDGLVVNVAKYLSDQPLLAVNPDTRRIDGILVPFTIHTAGTAIRSGLREELRARRITMARIRLNDGQELHAVNDFFIGQRTHVSARYILAHGKRREPQSSSGIIVSTGAGSTGWLRSVVTGASRIAASVYGESDLQNSDAECRFDWEAERLVYSVREPFISRVSRADLVYGEIAGDETLSVISQMPEDGVIFSDGVEQDYVEFNAGAIAEVGVAARRLRLLVPN
jgi:hypothetical protein